MINIEEIITKLDSVLNASNINNPTDFYYNVESVGFHIDSVADDTRKKNFIPVFVGTMGGNHNPVEELKQGTYAFSVTFYFPVRFKNSMYALYDYLAQTFIGAIINFGTYTGKCVTNISPANFGEIQNLDFKEFQSWVENTFHKKVEVMEPYLSMTLTLYLSNASSDFVYGNDVEMSATIEGQSLAEEKFVFAQGSLQSNSQAMSEQIIGTSESDSFPFSTSYGLSINVNVKNDDFFNYILQEWFDGKVQEIRLNLKMKLLGKTFQRYAFIESINMPITKGELLTMTISFAKTRNVA